ncbi:dTMP kinase [Amycolatopsis rubida]|uniref:Thymidylate kinase n=1 Tax=Amycolatopsis rubida TaxID=112413 RepID=A0ABX0BX70_9PSEU|nr:MULTISPECIES: dTMP kinase [Amycolatopsis]MYW92364.1 dTMP kinase [Amycolatopsis rubida]MYW95109.1 dTMP kinase [Amycolatopsis rubida]NEC57352.1 dTMP kinase [Amycolatopsis rubida]NEC60096.1 dTMP kinase [Amycolatopsis rubida]OAP24981.1 Thymidylate kinase [Amycolatopsis sp. M39]
MTGLFPDEPHRLPGTLITLDGPGGVGKSTAARLVTSALTAAGVPVHTTTQPSRAPLGELARHGTDTYRGMALACLCAADRHHQLAAEILPALCKSQVVVSDRYVASSLVLQGLDDVPAQTVWQLNHGIYQPDLSIILNGDPQVIDARLRARGGHSRFERAKDNSERETALYADALADLEHRGWPVAGLNATIGPPEAIAATIASLVQHVLTEKSPACL